MGIPESTKVMSLKLQTSDDKIHEIDAEIAKKFLAFEKQEPDESVVRIEFLDSVTLGKIIEWAWHHKDGNPEPLDDFRKETKIDDIGEWDNEFLKMDEDLYMNVLKAVDYLKFRELLELMCRHVARTIKGKTTEEIRNMFHIENDFTPEEEEEDVTLSI